MIGAACVPRATFVVAAALLVGGCKGEVAGAKSEARDGGAWDGGDTATDGTRPGIPARDPCFEAGYRFDGESDCYEVRCPELRCECPSTDPSGTLEGPTLTISACVPEAGCLSQLDCARACDPSLDLTRMACEERIATAGSLSCASDADCGGGGCREESIGRLCVDALGCFEHGHCGGVARCLFNPSEIDEGTGFPTALGDCSDGSAESICYEDDDCSYGRCSGQRCAAGNVGQTCERDSHCASGFCRISDPASGSGTCVGGEQGSSCIDDGDCPSELHCAGGVCTGSAVGQGCESDAQCEGGRCVFGVCRSGGPGARCEDTGDCESGYCVRSACTSGTLLAPCASDDDCVGGLHCGGDRCGDGAVRSPCTADDQCDTLACVRGLCSEGDDGDECADDADCKNGQCVRMPATLAGECTDGAAGALCRHPTDCNSNSCDSLAGACNP